MPLISSSILLTTLSLFHLTLVVYLLTSPATLANHPFVSILGSSMRLPSASPTSIIPGPFSSANPATACIALVLALSAISDLTAIALPRDAYVLHWNTQAPVRLCLLFGLCAWVYLSKPDEEGYSGTGAGFAGELKNGMVFAFGFVEIVWLFWIYSTLREERRQMPSRRKGVEEKTE